MRTIRMVTTISGSRPDGGDWRAYPAGSLLTCEDWEAAIHLRAGRAVEVPAEELPPPEPLPAPEKQEPPEQPEQEQQPGPHWAPNGELIPAAPAAVPEPGPQDTEAAAGGTEPGSEGIVPRPADPKRSWVDYAVSQGADRETAEAMTKVDLQSRYGGRL